MFRFLSSIRPTRAVAARRKSTPAPRRTRPSVEALEDRFLPSVTPVLQSPTLATAKTASTAPSANVPNLQGVSFYLSTSTNPYAGIVTVVSETPFSDVMRITGTWVDETQPGQKAGNPFSGSLARDSFGNVWIDITDGTNILITKVTSGYGFTPVGQYAVYGYYYSLDGSLSTPSGSYHVTGWGQPPPPAYALPY
jgi:hypothetical protein